MRILIDIGHPAHVHYYRNLAIQLHKNKHKVSWTVKDLSMARKLLDHYGFGYSIFPKKSDRILFKLLKQFQFDIKLLRFCHHEKIDIAIGTSASVAHISKISSVKSIVFDDDDDDVQPLVTMFVNPFADALLSPDALKGKRKRKDTIYYPGYHELAYLHPNRFTPNPEILDEVGLSPEDKFFIMRFNVFKAHHDIGVTGLSLDQKLKLIKILEPHGKILITTERNIEPELKRYQLKVSPEKVHSLMAFATIFLGDSQTMTSEAAVLGTPSLKCNSFAGRLSIPNELEEKFNLCYSFSPLEFPAMIDKLKALMAITGLKHEWQNRRDKMLKQKIDATGFWLWFVENHPESKQMITDKPEFWDQFR